MSNLQQFDFVVTVREGRRHAKHRTAATDFAAATEKVLDQQNIPENAIVRTEIIEYEVCTRYRWGWIIRCTEMRYEAAHIEMRRYEGAEPERKHRIGEITRTEVHYKQYVSGLQKREGVE